VVACSRCRLQLSEKRRKSARADGGQSDSRNDQVVGSRGPESVTRRHVRRGTCVHSSELHGLTPARHPKRSQPGLPYIAAALLVSALSHCSAVVTGQRETRHNTASRSHLPATHSRVRHQHQTVQFQPRAAAEFGRRSGH